MLSAIKKRGGFFFSRIRKRLIFNIFLDEPAIILYFHKYKSVTVSYKARPRPPTKTHSRSHSTF